MGVLEHPDDKKERKNHQKIPHLPIHQPVPHIPIPGIHGKKGDQGHSGEDSAYGHPNGKGNGDINGQMDGHTDGDMQGH